MENSKLLVKSHIEYIFPICLIILSSSVFFYIELINLFLILVIYVLLIWSIMAYQFVYFYFYEDRIEIYHPFFFESKRWNTVYYQNIKQIKYNSLGGGKGSNAARIKIISDKKYHCPIIKLEDRKIIMNLFYSLNIPIKMYIRDNEKNLIDNYRKGDKNCTIMVC